MIPLSFFSKCVKHKTKLQRAYHRSLRRVQPGRKHAKQRRQIINLWQRYVAKRRAA